MRLTACLASLVVVLTVAGSASAADDPSSKPRIGEVRAIAIDQNNAAAVAALQHDGWLAARGQLLEISNFPELFKTVGRTWTADDVSSDRFAIPELPDLSSRTRSSDNPFGVLGPGDLVTSGRASKAWLRSGRISYWIFTGQRADLPAHTGR